LAKQPTQQDIDVPNISGARPVASFDVSPVARGGQALARGAENLGQGIVSSAETIAAAMAEQARRQAENAKTDLATGLLADREQFQNSNDPDVKAQWDAQTAARRQHAVESVPPSAIRDTLISQTGQMAAQESLLSSEKAHTNTRNATVADINNAYSTAIQTYKYDPNEQFDPTHSALVEGLHAKIDNAFAGNLITAEERETWKQKAAKGIADRHMSLWSQADPEGFLRATGGWTPEGKTTKAYRGAAGVVSQAETGDPSLGPKAIGNISRDAGGTKSYGFTGLNSGSGSAAAFAATHGREFGLTAPVGSPTFDAQWKAAATGQTEGFRAAQVQWFQDHDVASVSRDLQANGIPAAAAEDPRVATYFADRHVQMGNLGIAKAGYAWDQSKGDVPTFLRKMNEIDGRPENLYTNFRTAIATGVYGPAGHATRLRTRLNGALAAGDDGGPDQGPVGAAGGSEEAQPQPTPATPHPLLGLVDPIDLIRHQTAARSLLQQHAQDQIKLNTLAVTDRTNQIQRLLIDANAGRAAMPPRELIENDPVLAGNEAHRNTLLSEWDKAQGQDAAFQGALSKFVDPQGGSFNHFDKNEEQQVDKIYQMLAGGDPAKAMPAMQAVVERTGIVPPSAASSLRNMLVSNNAGTVAVAAQMARNLMARNPQIFAGTAGAKDLEDAAVAFGQYTEHFGMTPEQAAGKIIEQAAPEYKAKVAARIKNEDVPTVIKNNLSVTDLQRAFGEGALNWAGIGRPSVEFTEEAKQAAFSDYAELFKDKYQQTGDVVTAKGQAIEQLKKVWGLSRFNGSSNGVLMRFPPERAPAYAAIPDVENRIAERALDAIYTAPGGAWLNEQGQREITRDKVMLTPTPGGETARAYMAGQPVPYLLSWFDKAGHLQMLDPGKAFVFDGEAEREKVTEERRAALQGRIEGNEAFSQGLAQAGEGPFGGTGGQQPAAQPSGSAAPAAQPVAGPAAPPVAAPTPNDSVAPGSPTFGPRLNHAAHAKWRDQMNANR
jgi:hypothetical protein